MKGKQTEETEIVQKTEVETQDLAPGWIRPPSISRADRSALWQGMLQRRRRQALDTWRDYKYSLGEMYGMRRDGWTEDDERQMTESTMERIASTAYTDLTWADLCELSNLTDEETAWGDHTEEALALWHEIKEHARDEMMSGHRAYNALGTHDDRPMDRARFIVLYESFVEQWQPKGGVERALIDQMAQAYTMWERWLKNSSLRQSTMWLGDMTFVFERSAWTGPPQSESDATKAAGDEADRWHRVYVRALRQLRDLRRYSVSITASQVNIGQQQTNVQAVPATADAPVTIEANVI